MSAIPKALTRDVTTPLTAVLFAVSTVTGVMLLLHWQAGLVRFSHEWLSIGFSAIGVWHLAKNWRTFAAYVRRRLPLAALVAGLAASLAMVAVTGSTAMVSPKAVFTALSAATLEEAAPAFGRSGEDAAVRLRDLGFTAAPADTLDAIGRRSGTNGGEIATLLARMAPPHPSAPPPSH